MEAPRHIRWEYRVEQPRLRPTFDVHVERPPDDTMRAIREVMESAPGSRRCKSKGRCAELFIADEDRKLWTPYLSVQAEDEPDGSTRLHGRFAPYPEVWTFFMFAYGVGWFAVLFGGAFGYAQWVSGESAWGLWGVAVGGVVVLGLHIVSALGQRLGSGAMRELRSRLDLLLEHVDAHRS